MTTRSAYRMGQHVRCGARIVEVCDFSPRYGGSYTLRGVWPPDVAGGQQSLSPRAQDWLLKPLAEADLCRLPRHGCGLIHVPAGYQIQTGT